MIYLGSRGETFEFLSRNKQDISTDAIQKGSFSREATRTIETDTCEFFNTVKLS